MPAFIRYSTADKADAIIESKNRKFLIVIKNGSKKFYPNTYYNQGVINSTTTRIQKSRY